MADVFDRWLLPMQSAVMAPLARMCTAKGLSADAITVTGFVVGLLAVPVLAAGWFGLGLVLILLNRFLDGLDGAVARQTGPTDRGAFADIAFDFFFYAAIPVGFALNDPVQNALPAAVLIASFVGTGSSFLAFAVIAARRGLTAADYPTKGIYYLGGLTEGAETILFFSLACLWPGTFPALAYGFATLCAVTAVLRWHRGWNAFQQ